MLFFSAAIGIMEQLSSDRRVLFESGHLGQVKAFFLIMWTLLEQQRCEAAPDVAFLSSPCRHPWAV